MPTQKSNNNRQQPINLNLFEAPAEETLDPAALAEIWARRAYELAQEPPAPAVGKTLDLLIFFLGKERYGIPVTNVREIYPREQLTPVPRTPNFVAGVFSARGRILSVIDLRAFFDLPLPANPAKKGNKGENSQAKIVVAADTDLSSFNAPRSGQMLEVGILADEVADVMTIFKEDIQPPLTTHTGVRAEYMQGITADLLVVLNLDTLLHDKRLIVQEELL
ncbi:MAG: purine-binding chemotaxis protein CheW [Anaerolineae bacterium]|nr:purine-binding chemotaxis protein CheW [Anaerolineae bacterium]